MWGRVPRPSRAKPGRMQPALSRAIGFGRRNTLARQGLQRRRFSRQGTSHAVLPKSFATLSSTPLTNCTDSGLENFLAISSASLITTARGVSG